jgi:hypothetical protein
VIENTRYEFGEENFAKIVNEGFLNLFKTPILHPQIFLPR